MHKSVPFARLTIRQILSQSWGIQVAGLHFAHSTSQSAARTNKITAYISTVLVVNILKKVLKILNHYQAITKAVSNLGPCFKNILEEGIAALNRSLSKHYKHKISFPRHWKAQVFFISFPYLAGECINSLIVKSKKVATNSEKLYFI